MAQACGEACLVRSLQGEVLNCGKIFIHGGTDLTPNLGTISGGPLLQELLQLLGTLFGGSATVMLQILLLGTLRWPCTCTTTNTWYIVMSSRLFRRPSLCCRQN